MKNEKLRCNICIHPIVNEQKRKVEETSGFLTHSFMNKVDQKKNEKITGSKNKKQKKFEKLIMINDEDTEEQKGIC